MQSDSAGAPGALPLRIEEIRDRAAVPGLAKEWEELSARAPDAGFFSSFDWVSCWLESFRRDRSLALLLARRGGRLVGVLPLLERPGAWLRGALIGATNEQSPRGPFVCDGDAVSVLEAILEHVGRTRGRAAIRLRLMPAEGPAVRALRQIESRDPVRAHGSPSRCSTRIAIQGGWAEYLATRSKHTQREWRRKRKRLDEAGAVEIRTVSAPADLPRALDDVLEIEGRSWKHGEGTSFQLEKGVEEFYRRLAERCAARGWLRLSLLYLNGRPAAHCLAVVYDRELLALKTSFDASLASLSPGLALMLAVTEQAFRDGLAAVDLLGHPDRWKLEMANEQRPHVDLCVFPRGLLTCELCAAYEDRIEPVLREKLPPRVADVGRRVLARFRQDA
jgi:CelD/BcsL family acetyltransferase involved in cellulose biosynthesis